MKDYIKKNAFICSGLFLIVGTFVLYNIKNVDASSTALKKFGAWTLNCTLNNDKKQICFLSQQINNTEKGKEKEVSAIYQIGYFNQEQTEKKLMIIEIVPPNVHIPKGTVINSGGELVAAGKYVNCTVNGCQAIATITSNELEMILSNYNYLEIVIADGRETKIPLIKDGLKEGLKAISK